MSFCKTIWILTNFVVYIDVTNGQEITSSSSSSAVTMLEELGFGAKGVTHYLKKLVDGCDNVGDLNNWIVFMESYLACEDAVWPYKSDEEKLLKTDQQLLLDFCEAWPKRSKCATQLARRLDFCYGPNSENGRKGSNALRFADSYARFICRSKSNYLDILEEVHNVPGDRKSVGCFPQNCQKLKKCAERKGSLLPASNICSNLEVLQDCIGTTFETSCSSESTIDWVKNVIKKIKGDLRC